MNKYDYDLDHVFSVQRTRVCVFDLGREGSLTGAQKWTLRYTRANHPRGKCELKSRKLEMIFFRFDELVSRKFAR